MSRTASANKSAVGKPSTSHGVLAGGFAKDGRHFQSNVGKGLATFPKIVLVCAKEQTLKASLLVLEGFNDSVCNGEYPMLCDGSH